MLEAIIVFAAVLLDRLTKLWAAGPLKAAGRVGFYPRRYGI